MRGADDRRHLAHAAEARFARSRRRDRDLPGVGSSGRQGPDLDIAGTVSATAHEYDDCYRYDGAAHGVKVIVVGKDGQEFSMNVMSSGNFGRIMAP